MAEVLPDNKLIARHALKVLGGKPQVITYWDDLNEHSIDLLICPDTPSSGLTSYSTVTLSDSPLLQGDSEFPVRCELVSACDSQVREFANVLCTAAFYVKKDRWFCRPGVVFESMVSEYNLSKTMEHLYFTAPSHWPALNTTLNLATKKVTWLWAIPISAAESKYIAENGDNEFESLLEEANADVFDIHRESIV
ncbi:MAG: suppressor of fused domain protein [Gemmataceae bacterium]|nr:suppressor of fused domain protein [Gemmataceae bacterium]